MNDIEFEGFSVELPAGWEDVLDEATYGDPDQPPPISFSGGGVGSLSISAPLYVEGQQPGGGTDDAERLVLDWARRRGLTPTSLHKDSSPRGGFACGAFEIAKNYVEVWFLTNGRGVVHVDYVCPFGAQDQEREARDHIAATLRIT